MRKVGSNTYTEIYFPGCNPSFVVTSDGVVMIDTPQQPIDAVRWRERILEKGPIRYLINTEPHGDHILGNSYFPGVQVVGQKKLQECFTEYSIMMGSNEAKKERFAKEDPDSVWLVGHPDYPLNPPTKTFEDKLTLNVGNHTFHCIHMPGHTAPQTSVYVPEEGVVFTGDTIFCRCKTWLQEANPWAWLDALKALEALDVETIVPGHGEPCGKDYVREQRQIIENWLGLVAGYIDRGMTEEEAIAAGNQLPVPLDLDPFPIGQRLAAWERTLNGYNVANLYRVTMAHREGKPIVPVWKRA